MACKRMAISLELLCLSCHISDCFEHWNPASVGAKEQVFRGILGICRNGEVGKLCSGCPCACRNGSLDPILCFTSVEKQVAGEKPSKFQ